MQRRNPMRRTPLKRTPLKTKTARPSRKPRRAPDPDREFWQTQRTVLYIRAGGRCEHCGADLNTTGLEAHHRKLRSQGGGHGVENLAALCPTCHHDRIHAHPTYAVERGFIVPMRANPCTRALVLHDGRTVRLNTDGTYDECWEEVA